MLLDSRRRAVTQREDVQKDFFTSKVEFRSSQWAHSLTSWDE